MIRKPETWMADGACRFEAPAAFFPDGSTGGWVPVIKHAKNICAACPVLQTCRTWALDTRQPYGIWGGLTEQERRRVYNRLANNSTMTRDQAISAVLHPRGTGRPIGEMFAERTEVDANGHTRWLLRHTTILAFGRVRTPNQVGFILTHNREPMGRVTSTCGITGCVTGTHLGDEQVRRELAAQANEPPAMQAAA